MINQIHQGDSEHLLKQIESDSIDAIITDPPYGYSFMNKDWDKAVVSVDIWKECLRVLKPGAFAAIMSSPRQDVLARMIVNLQDAGFRTDFTSIYWTYASGFPKAANVSKLVDKRGYENERYSELSKDLCDYLKTSREKLALSQKDVARHFLSKTGGLTGCVWNWENGANIPTMKQWNKFKEILKLNDEKFIELIERAILRREEAERNKIPSTGNLHKNDVSHGWSMMEKKEEYLMNDAVAITEKAKSLDGSYAGFQPKPAVEVILMVMKPLSEKSYVDQALSNSKGITWLDSVRIPYQTEDDREKTITGFNKSGAKPCNPINGWNNNDMISHESKLDLQGRFPANLLVSDDVLNDCSRYFDLDKWFDTTFPFLAVPKASSSEKNKGLDNWMEKPVDCLYGNRDGSLNKRTNYKPSTHKNFHPTVKPLKLMSWLVTLLSRPNDIVLDPFCGSGSTLLAAKMLKRKWMGFELNPEYVEIAKQRTSGILFQ